MFRRIACLLLVPCLLMPPSAALGHSHDEGQPTGHDLRPHVHTNFASAKHQHHHRGPGGHHHDDDADSHEAATSLPLRQLDPVSDHDSDAIYVGAVDPVALVRSAFVDGVEESVWLTAADAVSLAESWEEPPAFTAFCYRPPPDSRRVCPLYIRHLALLI